MKLFCKGYFFNAEAKEKMNYTKEDIEESEGLYFKRIVLMNKHGDFTLTAKYDISNVEKLFEEYNCTIVKAPKKLHRSSIITFYRNSDPGKLKIAHLDVFCEEPNGKFRKSRSKLKYKPVSEA